MQMLISGRIKNINYFMQTSNKLVDIEDINLFRHDQISMIRRARGL